MGRNGSQWGKEEVEIETDKGLGGEMNFEHLQEWDGVHKHSTEKDGEWQEICLSCSELEVARDKDDDNR